MLRLVGFLFVFLPAVQAVAVCPTVLSDCTATPGYKSLSLNGGYLLLGNWTTSGRPSPPVAGMTGFNTTIGATETYNGSAWVAASGGGSGSPGGTNGQIQFNNSSTFGGLTNTQLTADINAFSASLSGATPASGGGTTNFLRADGSWVAPAGTGTVTNASVVTANGFAGTVANSTTTPAITITTSVSGIAKGNGTALSAATAGTDYLAPTGNGSGLTGLLWSQIGSTPTTFGGYGITGGTLTGEIITAASTTGSAGLNLPPGTAPTSPVNGDLWLTASGLFARVAGVTVGPFGTGGGTGCTVGAGAAGLLVTANGSSGCQLDGAASVVNGALSLGSSGVAGSVAMGNVTSGTLILQPATGALGAVTVSIPAATDTLANLAGTQALTNKTISGSSNTLSNIGNGSLTNSSMTIAGHAVALGGTQALACADLSTGAAGCSAASANPTATAGPTAVNGSATTYMRSDAAPAAQKAGAAQFGIIEPDNATMLCPSGVCSTTLTDTVHSSGTVTTANIGGEDDYASGAAGATLATLATGQSLLVADLSAGALPIGLNGQTVTGCPLPTSLHNAGFYAFTFNSASTVSCYGNPGYGTITTGALAKFVDGSGALTAASAADLPATPLLTGTSTSLVGPRQYYVCTSTCTVTPPVPVAGYEFCVMNDDNVSTVITLAALGSSARYESTARTAYGTAGTGTFVSGGAVADKVCIVGRDATHYLTTSFNGTWVTN